MPKYKIFTQQENNFTSLTKKCINNKYNTTNNKNTNSSSDYIQNKIAKNIYLSSLKNIDNNCLYDCSSEEILFFNTYNDYIKYKKLQKNNITKNNNETQDNIILKSKLSQNKINIDIDEIVKTQIRNNTTSINSASQELFNNISNFLIESPVLINENLNVTATSFTIVWKKNYNSFKLGYNNLELPFINNYVIEIQEKNDISWTLVSDTISNNIFSYTFNQHDIYGNIEISSEKIYNIRVYAVNNPNNTDTEYNYLYFNNIILKYSNIPSYPTISYIDTITSESFNINYISPYTFDISFENSDIPQIEKYEIIFKPVENNIRNNNLQDLNTYDISFIFDVIDENQKSNTSYNYNISNIPFNNIFPSTKYTILSFKAKNINNTNFSDTSIIDISFNTQLPNIEYGSEIFKTFFDISNNSLTEVNASKYQFNTIKIPAITIKDIYIKNNNTNISNANYINLNNIDMNNLSIDICNNIFNKLYINRKNNKIGSQIRNVNGVSNVYINYDEGNNIIEDLIINFNGYENNLTNDGSYNIYGQNNIFNVQDIYNIDSYNDDKKFYNGYGLLGKFKLLPRNILDITNNTNLFSPNEYKKSIIYNIQTPIFDNSYNFDFFIDNLHGLPDISGRFSSITSYSTNYLYGIPSIYNISFNLLFDISNISKFFLPKDAIYLVVEISNNYLEHDIININTNNSGEIINLNENIINKNISFTSNVINTMDTSNIINGIKTTVINLNGIKENNMNIVFQDNKKLHYDSESYTNNNINSFGTNECYYFDNSNPFTLPNRINDISSTNFDLSYNQLLFYQNKFVSGGYNGVNTPFRNWLDDYVITGKNYSDISYSGDNIYGDANNYKFIIKRIKQNFNANRNYKIKLKINGIYPNLLNDDIIVHILQYDNEIAETTIWYDIKKTFTGVAFRVLKSFYSINSDDIGIYDLNNNEIYLNTISNCDIYLRIGIKSTSNLTFNNFELIN